MLLLRSGMICDHDHRSRCVESYITGRTLERFILDLANLQRGRKPYPCRFKRGRLGGIVRDSEGSAHEPHRGRCIEAPSPVAPADDYDWRRRIVKHPKASSLRGQSTAAIARLAVLAITSAGLARGCRHDPADDRER